MSAAYQAGALERANPRIQLSRFEAARYALAEARRVDEVKDIRDKAVALAEYARQAKDTELLEHATEIRLRAERRWGEIYAVAQKAEGMRGDTSVLSGGVRSTPPEESETPTLEDMGVTKTQSSKWQKLAELPDEKFEIRIEHAKARVEGMTTSAPNVHGRVSGRGYAGENEWYTPAETIEAARAVLGGIDLDPASHQIAQQTVKATRFFTAADDGLKHVWHGRVFLNPPYGRGLIAPFVDKLLSELNAQRVKQAILLTHACVDTGWFHAAGRASQAFCLMRGRVAFVAPCGDAATSTVHGQAFFYFGPDDRAFRRVFSEIGLIVRPA